MLRYFCHKYQHYQCLSVAIRQAMARTFSNLQSPFLSSAAIAWHRFKRRLKFVSNLVSILTDTNETSLCKSFTSVRITGCYYACRRLGDVKHTRSRLSKYRRLMRVIIIYILPSSNSRRLHKAGRQFSLSWANSS